MIPRHRRQVHVGLTTPKYLKKSRYFVRRCPIEGCGKQVARVRDHLVRKHQLKGKEVIDELIEKSTTVLEEPRLEPSTSKTTERQVTEQELKYFEVASITRFIGWLQGPDQLKNERTSQQHGSQVFNIWQHVRTEKEFRICELMDVDIIKDKWLPTFMKSFAPGTIKSYLGSLVLFYKFIIDKSTSKDTRVILHENITRLTNIAQKLSKIVHQRQTEVQTLSLETRITQQEIQEFVGCDFCKGIEKQLIMANNNMGLNMYTRMRDYLILRLSFANAQRAGAILNLTTRHVERAKITSEGATIMVDRHKTSYIAPASLALPTPLYQYLLNYMKTTRRLRGFKSLPQQPVFVTYPMQGRDPVPLTASTLNAGMRRLWKKTGFTTSISTTDIRKCVVTTIRKQNPHLREDLAYHMSHAPATADKYYNISNRRDRAIGISKIISKTLLETPKKTPTIESVQPEASASVSPSTDSHDQVTSSRRVFDNANVQKLMRLCPNFLKRKSFSTSDVISHLQSTEAGLAFLLEMQNKLGHAYRKQIVDRIRTYKKAHRN